MPLRTTNLKDIERFEDGDAWLVLRVGGLSKGEADRLRDLTASFRMDPRSLTGDAVADGMIEINNRVAQANRALIEILVVEWSLETADGEAIPVTGDSYARLDEESGQWVDDCIAKVLEKRAKRAEGKAPSSKRPRARASSSARAAA